MKDLFQHVEHLLTEHNCVVVPGLGGFVLHDNDSRVDESGEVFHPKGKEITFNIRLTFNDGILVQSYMESELLSFEGAVELIHERVSKLHEWLDEGRVVAFGRLGTLLKNTEGKLTFRPDNRNLYCPEAYGLSTFVFPTLAQRSKTTLTEQQHAQDRTRSSERTRGSERTKRTSGKITLVQLLTGAAACLIMLLISKPVGQLKEHEAQEAFLLHSYVDSGQRRPSSMKPPVASTGITTQPILKDTFIPDKEALSLIPTTAAVTPSKEAITSSKEAITPSKTTGTRSKATGQGTDAKPAEQAVRWRPLTKPRQKGRDLPSTDDIDSLFGFNKPMAVKSIVGKTDSGNQARSTFSAQQADDASGPSPSDYFPYRTPQSAATHNTSITNGVQEALPVKQLSAKASSNATTEPIPVAKTRDDNANKTPRYYIVISSHATKATATQWMNQHREGLYENANIVEGDGRARIYLRSFSNKVEAETFLNTFRSEHPQHEDAWLLSKRS